jgi:hypothetical protein
MSLKAVRMSRERRAAASAAPTDGSFGFAEDLGKETELQKLLGLNYIDDGALYEQDGPSAAESIRGLLASMDNHAATVRSELVALVKDGLSVVEGVQTVNLGEGTEQLSRLKPALSRLMTAYTEIVAELQSARDTIGYDVDGPAVTSGGSDAVSERITRGFAQRRTRGLAEERRPVTARK